MISIIIAELSSEDAPVWACWLEISQGEETWMLPATAPGTLAEGELQAHFDAMESYLWGVAQAKQYEADLYQHIAAKRVLKAFAGVVLDEINILRGVAGLPERTGEQLRQAIKAKLRQ